ncbi:DUF2207 domain-containing protein [Hoyosella sp. YIM 151337]|uniref:DUF2207 domain-containing protein n=1 Tax=Hoyosella sp. YIM 151337 TaxID=2992742 RepID=UPI002235AD95|nr:DUF2207 domain-containing protein [Hoyosella sp. YIM 151337]MCW4354388.1 DUF2207 domain-containing protein [Hoyosella sp. YIM 151337]
MKRFVFVAVCFLSLLVPAPALAQSTDAFTFSNFEADYYLSQDDDGRAELRVVEHLTAEFPTYDQNKGIVREIPRYFDGHHVSLQVESVTRNGASEPIYDQYSSGDFTVVETGTDDYVHGTQTYEIAYTMRDVILDSGDYQEFYWNTNGTGWNQPFEKLTARIHLDAAVREAFTGDIRCFIGAYGASEECAGRDDGEVITFQAPRPLAPEENVTVAAMFEPATFEPFDAGPVALAARFAMFGSAITAFGALLFAARFRVRHGRSAPRNAPVSQQYVPPQDLSLIEAAAIKGASGPVIPAQILDLAVRGNLRIIETEKTGFLASGTEYSAELVNTEGLRHYERSLIDILFPRGEVGERYAFAEHKSDVSKQLQELQAQARRDAVEFGYRKQISVGWPLFAIAGAALVVSGIAAVLLINQPPDWRYGLLAASIGFAIIAVVTAIDIKPLTPKGRELVDHIDGLKMYIEAGEADRINATQSPGAAPTAPVSAFSADQAVHIHERLLPYAVLFGHAKKWVRELTARYEEHGRTFYPVWYYGTQPFSSASFGESMNSFVSSPGGPSGSSGFSSSGGFSGGGGGGGGGGGR